MFRSRTAVVLAALAILLCSPALATNRQFNTLTPPSPQAPAVNPAVQLLETCATCEPPKRSESVLESACADCPKAEKLPPPLQPDCVDCGHGEDAMFTTAPFTTADATCPDCDPMELHPSVGWRVDTERTGSGVDLVNGELFMREVDFDIPGRGFSFRFIRRHVGASYDGPLGAGWDFNYNMRIVVDGQSCAVIIAFGANRRLLRRCLWGRATTTDKNRFSPEGQRPGEAERASLGEAGMGGRGYRSDRIWLSRSDVRCGT